MNIIGAKSISREDKTYNTEEGYLYIEEFKNYKFKHENSVLHIYNWRTNKEIPKFNNVSFWLNIDGVKYMVWETEIINKLNLNI